MNPSQKTIFGLTEVTMSFHLCLPKPMKTLRRADSSGKKVVSGP